MRKLAELGVDGIHFQDFFARPLDFNPTVGRTPDRASWEGGLECLRDILQTCRAVQPEFALSTDSVWDCPLGLSQVCSAEGRDRSVLRASFPFWQATYTLTDDSAFNAINNSVRNRARLRVAPADGQPLGGSATAAITNYLRVVLAAREVLSHTLLEGEVVATNAALVESAAKWSVFRNPKTGLRTVVLMNARAEPLPARFAGFVPSGDRAVRAWQPSQGATNIALPVRFVISGRGLAFLTEETVADKLPVAAVVSASTKNERIVFDLASSEDLEGWTLTGSFSVATVPGLVPKPTLNSVAIGGEMATGTALSPAFTVEPQFSHLEVLLQGGLSEQQNGRENLVLRIIDATTDETLEQLFPPGIHELRTQRVSLDKLKGRTIRLQLADENRNASFAWIGLRKVALKPAPANQ
jgi:hypothetical protein